MVKNLVSKTIGAWSFILALLKVVACIGFLLSVIKFYFPDWIWWGPDVLRWFIIIPFAAFAVTYMIVGIATVVMHKKD